MDRRILVVLFLALSGAVGCGGSKNPPAKSGPTTASATGGAATSAQTHRPIIVGNDPFDPQSLRPTEVSPSLAGSPNAADDPRFTPRAANPLRVELPAALPPPPAENPLRTFSAEPRLAEQPSALRLQIPPEEAPRDVPRMAVGPAAVADAAAAPTRVERPATAAANPAAATPPAAAGPYEVVEVFYGTDRLAAEPLANDWPARIVRFLPAMCSSLLTLGLALVASRGRQLGLWLLVFGGIGVSLGLGFQATSRTILAIRQTSKAGRWYTTERSLGNRIEVGRCEVTIPKTHISGELESPTVLRLEVREDAAQHVVLHSTERLADERFYELLRQRVAASPRRELFVFVHGFNVSFEDAARRTAQIHHDLHFAGAPVFFSWPARDKFVLTYPADESAVATSTPNLKRFLLEIVERTEARSINLIAHSMGNRALGVALREIDLELRGQSRLFNQVILAAPDIDAEDFRTNIAPAMQRTAQRLTLYASSRDDALLASQLLHRGPRAGDAGAGLVVIPGIDTIDVTAIDSSPWGHSYYGSSDPVLTDLKALLLEAAPAQDRSWLSPAERDGQTYWIFQPARTAASPLGTPR